MRGLLNYDRPNGGQNRRIIPPPNDPLCSPVDSLKRSFRLFRTDCACTRDPLDNSLRRDNVSGTEPARQSGRACDRWTVTRKFPQVGAWDPQICWSRSLTDVPDVRRCLEGSNPWRQGLPELFGACRGRSVVLAERTPHRAMRYVLPMTVVFYIHSLEPHI
jgi:hypothetical protein